MKNLFDKVFSKISLDNSLYRDEFIKLNVKETIELI